MASLISVLISCLLVGIPAFISEFLYRYRELAADNTKFRAAHASYITGFRVKANILNLMFYPIFMFRRLTFAATIVLLYDVPAVQIAFLNIGTLSFAVYLYYWKPYKNKYSFYSAVSSEVFFMIFTSVLYYFTVPRDDQTSSIVGWVLISVVIASLGVSWTCVAMQQIRAWKRRAQKKGDNPGEENQGDTKGVEKPEELQEIPKTVQESQQVPLENPPEEEVGQKELPKPKVRENRNGGEGVDLEAVKIRLQRIFTQRVARAGKK